MALADELRIALDGRWREVRDRARVELAREDLLPDPALDLAAKRERVRKQLPVIARTGTPRAGFGAEYGGWADLGGSITGFEMLAYADLSLMVKAGVQWGLFGGAIESLGTEHHHQKYLRPLIDLDLLGCFAMTETGHGSDVQQLETTATYDPQTQEFVIHSPTASSRKDYIGGAAADASVAAVFAQLITADGADHGVHCFVVGLRDEHGHDLPGVTTSDCGPKGGLDGVDNGRILFDHVRVPRQALLNRYADVDPAGTYTSPIENPNRRFFTMLGTLIRGRVSVAGAAGSAARLALCLTTRYALRRRQFSSPGADRETLLMDYRLHQRRILPLIAGCYALQFAQNEMVAKMHNLEQQEAPDEREHRRLEKRAAGIKATATWHATRTIQECREACGGAGYMAENRLTTLKEDTDVFTTFEGDNHVLTQMVAKEVLTAYADEVRGLDPLGMARFAATTVADMVKERTAAAPLIQRLIDARGSEDEDNTLFERGTQLKMFEDREQHLLETAARRLRSSSGDEQSAFEAFNAAQDHVVHAGQAHTDRIVLEAFVAAIDNCADPDAREVLETVCDLYALSVIERDKAWFTEHNRLSTSRAKAVTAAVNELCARLRPHARDLVDAFGIPEEMLGAAMLNDPAFG